MLLAQAVRIGACLLAGNPLAVACFRSNLAVQRHRIFQCDKRPLLRNPGEEALVQAQRLLLAHARLHLDALQAQIFQSLTCDLGVRVQAGTHNLADAGTRQRHAARTSAAIVGARLQRHISSSALRQIFRLRQRVHLGMRLACLMVIALANDAAIVSHNDAAHHRIRAGVALRLKCKLQRTLHILFICQHNLTF